MHLEKYGWFVGEGTEAAKRQIRMIRQLARRLKPSLILDVGCGNGYMVNELGRDGHTVVGIDADQRGLELAKASNVANVCFKQADIESTNQVYFKGGLPLKADLVISCDVIEHLYNPIDYLKFVKNHIARDGHFVLSTPYHGYLKNCLIAMFGLWDRHHTTNWIGGHVRFYSRATIRELLENNGFEIYKLIGHGRFAPIWKSLIVHARLKQ